LPAAAAFAAEINGKGHVFPSSVVRYADQATEFSVARLTDPAHSSFLPAFYNRAVARRGSFLLYSSDLTGRMQAFRLDLKNGQSRQITDCEDLDPTSLTLVGDNTFCFVEGTRIFSAGVAAMRPREVSRIADGFEHAHGFAVAEDGQYAALVEKSGTYHRLRLVNMMTGAATTIAEADEEISDPIPRPRRASVLYRRAGGVWLANHDGQQ